MADDFSMHQDSASGPSREPYAVTPHDTNALTLIPKRLYVGTGGDITLRGVRASADVVYRNVADGIYLNVRPSHIRATGTTASNIVAEA